jgi:hypothetical protein
MKTDINLCTSLLVVKKGKIFMQAVFESGNPSQCHNEHIIAEASLSVDYSGMLTWAERGTP